RGAGVPPVTRGGEGGVDLVDQHHVARVVELGLGHVDVDPGEVADGHAVRPVDGAPEAGVDALGGDPGRHHPSAESALHPGAAGAERAVHPGQAGERHTRTIDHARDGTTANAGAAPTVADAAVASTAWSDASSGSRTSTASPAPSAASVG